MHTELNAIDHTSLPPSRQVTVGQHEWGTTGPKRETIRTRGLANCIGVLAVTAVAGGPQVHLAHLYEAAVGNRPDEPDAGADLFFDSLIAAADPQNIKVTVRGGLATTSAGETLDDTLESRDYTLRALADLGIPDENIDVEWNEDPTKQVAMSATVKPARVFGMVPASVHVDVQTAPMPEVPSLPSYLR